VLEETGLKVTSIKSIYKMHNFELFHCKCNASVVKLSDEHVSYKWTEVERALDKMHLTRETHRDLIESINKNILKVTIKMPVKIKKKLQTDVDKEDKEDK
jgi:hypothetical protein